MASDPYRAPEVAPDVPIRNLPQTTDPLRTNREARMSTAFWVPIALALAFVIGLSYYYRHTDIVPNALADAGAVTASVPSPN